MAITNHDRVGKAMELLRRDWLDQAVVREDRLVRMTFSSEHGKRHSQLLGVCPSIRLCST
jgi:hypothetical protein